MDSHILINLINNAALLLAMCLVYDALSAREEQLKPGIRQILSGTILGTICIAVMLNPLHWQQGIIFDTRSVLLCVAGLFFAPLTAFTTMIIAVAYRIHLGGNGVWMGVAVILASGSIAMIWKSMKKTGLEATSLAELYVLGLIVHLVMLVLMALLPGPIAMQTLGQIGIPILVVYPVATALLGKLMANRRARNQADAALKESEERWQYALEGSGDGVWDHEIQTGKVFYSDQWKRMLGFARSEIAHTPESWKELIHPEDREKVLEELHRHQRGESPEYLAEYRIRCKDNSYKWVLARGKVTARDQHGNALRIVGTHTDITDRRLLEEQLRQAQKMEAVGQLAGGVAHDFNNILTTIIGRTYLLQSKLGDRKDLLVHAEQVTLAAERATALTQGLLSFSREQVLDLRRISLNETVRKASNIFSRLVREDIEISIQLSEENPVICADESQIIQVLMNLVTNARDAIAGPGTIGIITEAVVLDQYLPMTTGGPIPPGSYAALSVTDTGSGMNGETQKRIFEPFYTTKEVGKGTGLGLSVVYGIIERHNGYISVQSDAGKGSTFSVYLTALAEQSEPQPVNEALVIPKGRGTILLAEDENSVRQMLKTILTENGYRVIEAVNGVDAVLRFSENRHAIDLVLLDMIMPRMNGREAREEILKTRRDVKVLFMSGYSGEILGEGSLEQEGVGFIHKPINPREIIRQLQETLPKRNTESS
ncbi:MAG: hybrid sensor histidine kinase/response regulator [Deltaproteobacteria bacterium]|nr:hybrid sensor histidine kinase/response regulator [Deltaproteobacteria bacterium]TLN04977.1 MAG: response regulator [bacterium]